MEEKQCFTSALSAQAGRPQTKILLVASFGGGSHLIAGSDLESLDIVLLQLQMKRADGGAMCSATLPAGVG